LGPLVLTRATNLEMISHLLSRVISLGLGTLYPAYASYKAVRTKNVKEYVKWMMYWIVFALFTALETFTDFFFAWWFPLYYEMKIIVLVYLLSPYTHGSSILYRKFVHPTLVQREERIDAMLESAQTQSYNTAMELGQRGIRYVTGVVMEGALRAPGLMADIVQTGQLGMEPRGRAGSLQNHLPQQRHQNETFQLAPEARLGDLDMSDDDTVPAAPGQIVEVHSDEVDSQSQDSGEAMQVDEPEQGAGPRRRRRKAAATADASFSSGGEEEDPDFQLPSTSKTSRGGKAGAKKSTTAGTTRKSTRRAKQQ